MNDKKFLALTLLSIGLLLVAGCGPSPEQQATMTAAAWTPTPRPTNTPPPTNTPTPIPYDLSLSVADGEGNPVAGAQVTFDERDETQAVDETGQLSWTDLGGETASFTVAAQGYLPAEASATLERGQNIVEIVLERDPYGLLPSEACASNETVLYIEDFQDNSAAGWQQIDFHGGGWTIADRSDQTGNLIASNNLPDSHPSDMLQGQTFDQAVWRFWYMASGPSLLSLNWRQSFNYDLEDLGHVNDARYQILVDTQNGNAIRRLELPQVNIQAAGSGFRAKVGEWHLLEISTFEETTELWIDGTRVLSYSDPKPLAPGTVAFEIIEGGTASDTVTSFDNIVVCELSAPFTSIVTGNE